MVVITAVIVVAAVAAGVDVAVAAVAADVSQRYLRILLLVVIVTTFLSLHAFVKNNLVAVLYVANNVNAFVALAFQFFSSVLQIDRCHPAKGKIKHFSIDFMALLEIRLQNYSRIA